MRIYDLLNSPGDNNQISKFCKQSSITLTCIHAQEYIRMFLNFVKYVFQFFFKNFNCLCFTHKL